MANDPGKPRKSENKETLLFVYGTLLRGGKLHGVLETPSNVTFVGIAKIRAELYRLPGEHYPGAVLTSRRNRFVHGELYALIDPDRILKRLDVLEGCDEGLFKRQLVNVWRKGTKHKAWSYFYGKSVSNAEFIPGGKFLPGQAVV